MGSLRGTMSYSQNGTINSLGVVEGDFQKGEQFLAKPGARTPPEPPTLITRAGTEPSQF